MNTAFTLNPNFVKPYTLMDLDDTLFQTFRKIEAWQLASNDLTVATVNKQGKPLSYFTPKQAEFFNWLYHSTELIPVTARDTTEIQRVKLPFASWQILTHGAVILDNRPDATRPRLTKWEQVMCDDLILIQNSLERLTALLNQHSDEFDIKITPHYDEFCDRSLMTYVAVKHAQKQHGVLENLAQRLPELCKDLANFDHDFYIHTNANNLAILPNCVHKRHAVAFLLTYYLDSNRPTFGFGDSMADLGFLQLLDWYGTPSRGQVHDWIITAK